VISINYHDSSVVEQGVEVGGVVGRTGVTQDEVFEICDAMLRAGERPTQQTVRSKLGTGSMATIQRGLDAWWRGLPARLDAQRSLQTREDLPGSVAELAAALWAEALAQANEAAHARLTPAYAQLEAERRGLEAARVELEADARSHAAARIEAEQLRLQAEARSDGLQAALAALQLQVAEAAARTEAAESTVLDQNRVIQDLRDRSEHERRAAIDRAAEQEAHVRALEDRAHSDVDRARQAQKAAEDAQRRLEERMGAAERQHQAELATARRLLTGAIQASAVVQAERDRLAAEVSSLKDLLERALHAGGRRTPRAGPSRSPTAALPVAPRPRKRVKQ
jgi:hypothetical protein